MKPSPTVIPVPDVAGSNSVISPLMRIRAPDNLVEVQRYGIEKGVATAVDSRTGKFEAANGGTFFLDEIGDLSLAAQAKILRVLQERVVDRVGGHNPIPIDVRVIAASNKNLERAIREGTFREDLYYRLKVVCIQTPPLREIAQDIPIIAKHFLAKHCEVARRPVKEFAPAAIVRLKNYSWPGNARQLENEVKRLVASVRGTVIGADQLDLPNETVAGESSGREVCLDGKHR
jgi:DNA-binding NtrC family response regulator